MSCDTHELISFTLQKALAGGDLYDAGTETALGGGEFGATKPEGHVLYSYYTRYKEKTRSKTQCENAPASLSGQNNNGIKCLD